MRTALIGGVLATLAVGLAVTGALGQAAAEDGCGRFDWPVDREQELFADGLMADVESKSALPRDGVFSLRLQPVAQVIYLVPPERARDDGMGGVVTLEWISAGRWQITVSADAWIDVVQDDRRLVPLATTARLDCPGIRQSIQFQVEGVPLTLQFGGASVQRLNIAVLRAR
jgi:hypothetical protein